MNKGGVGVGSASVVLIFSVLCLTVFSLISFVVARNGESLVESESDFVLGYYEADALAERVLAELLKADPFNPPASINGIDIAQNWDGTVSYSCPLSGTKDLYVVIANNGDSFDILSWRMRDTGEWQADTNLHVFDFDAPMWDSGPPMWDISGDSTDTSAP